MGIKYSINETFFTKWSSNMAYVLGFFCADGTMIDDKISRGKYVRFINTDKNILIKIKEALNSEHNIYTTKATANRKAKYVLSIGNKTIYSSLIVLDLTPNKSLDIAPPSVPKQYINDFVRGYCDGDGCIYIEKQSNTLRLIFTSGSSGFLVGLAKMITLMSGVSIKNILNSHRSYQLRYTQNDAITILRSIYKNTKSGLYLERKRKIFQKFIKNR